MSIASIIEWTFILYLAFVFGTVTAKIIYRAWQDSRSYTHKCDCGTHLPCWMALREDPEQWECPMPGKCPYRPCKIEGRPVTGIQPVDFDGPDPEPPVYGLPY